VVELESQVRYYARARVRRFKKAAKLGIQPFSVTEKRGRERAGRKRHARMAACERDRNVRPSQ